MMILMLMIDSQLFGICKYASRCQEYRMRALEGVYIAHTTEIAVGEKTDKSFLCTLIETDDHSRLLAGLTGECNWGRTEN